MHIHYLVEMYSVRIIVHTDHQSKELLPWIGVLLDVSEKNLSSTVLTLKLIIYNS